jgi:hypothetical protein
MHHFQCKCCDWFAQGPRRSAEVSLVRHLRQVYGITAPPSAVTATQTQSMARPPPINTTPTITDAFEQAICEFIVDTLQPFDLVKTPSFCRIFEGCGIHLPTVEGVREHIIRDFDIYYALLRSELDSTLCKPVIVDWKAISVERCLVFCHQWMLDNARFPSPLRQITCITWVINSIIRQIIADSKPSTEYNREQLRGEGRRRSPAGRRY